MIPRITRLLYRRRPPRIVLALFLVTSTACAQTIVDTLSIPYSSSFDLESTRSAFFTLPATEERPLYITLSICSSPESISNAPLPRNLNTTLYVSNSSTIQTPGPDSGLSMVDKLGGTSKLHWGAGNVTLDAASEGLWVGVYAPDDAELGGTGGGTWTFELDLTTIAPLVTADGGASFRFEDSDRTNALLSTSNWTAQGLDPSSVDTPSYFPIVSESTPLSHSLGRSRCFMRSQVSIPQSNVSSSSTTRGYGGGTRTQFELEGLREGTNYTAWLVQNLTEVSDSTNATRLWDPVFFTTKTSSSCRLVYDLDFCPSVAYSVPAPLSLPTSDLIDHFNATLAPSLEAFARSLTTFPCNSTRFGQYSVVSTCQDCYEAYRDWICSTTIPRCTDAPENATILSNSSWFDPATNLATWTIPDSYSPSILRSYPPASRTPQFAPANLSSTFPSLFNSTYPPNRENTMNESPFPYSEVPPCMDNCHLVDARCPTFLAWGCPTSGGTGTAVYGETKGVSGGDRVAGDVRDSTRNERSQDRFGNVYCNALDSDLKMAAQFVRLGATSSSPRLLDPARFLTVFFVLLLSISQVL